jgi:glucuronosyltransferase
MHVSEEVKPLPKDMETFVQGAGDKGFIYVSFGSEADMAKSPGDIRSIFFKALGKSEARFLWRWSGERPKDMPANVMTASWMPQQDILGHPKCRGFITHGGLLSMQEAVIHGVPMITFPIFAEQDYNSERLQRTGRGIRLEIGELTQADLETAIHRLLNDPSLKEQMRLTSMRFKDRPEKPVDTAVWWVNYLFRHEDLSFLRPRGASLYWYQRRQLDAWAFIAAIFFLWLYSSWKIMKMVFGLCCGSSSRKNVAVAQGKKRN